MRPCVCVINTGGTLTMVNSERGYVPSAGFLEKVMDRLPLAWRESIPDIRYSEWTPLLDSSNIEPRHWQTLAQQIADQHDEVTGFVILHGTDTLAYSASALSFLLPGLSRPVILTGAMQPLDVRNSDAPNHWYIALQAACSQLPEVAIAFDNRLMRGCRSTKLNAAEVTAFASPRYPDLGRAQTTPQGPQWQFAQANWLESRALQHLSAPLLPGLVRVVWLVPGLPDVALRALPDQGCRVLILVIFGSGNAPSANPTFMATLSFLRKAGVHILTVSQCPFGQIEDSHYEAGRCLQDLGIQHGRGITLEAAYTKALVGASQAWDNSDLDSFLLRNQIGEQG